MNILGIDYGSKLAGTTVAAQLTDDGIQLFSSVKGKDADAFLLKLIAERQTEAIYLDAPLSLPGVYRGLEGCDDYFYRRADRELRAMSPMFLGGLTARAMRLKAQLQPRPVYEVYPGVWAGRWEWKKLGYKKKKGDLAVVLKEARKVFPFALPPEISSWHALDALLAAWAGWRHQHGEAEEIGEKAEGQILI